MEVFWKEELGILRELGSMLSIASAKCSIESL